MTGATGTLANFFVEIASKGVDQVNKEIDQIGYGLKKDEQEVQSLGKAFAAAMPTAAVQAAGATAALGGMTFGLQKAEAGVQSIGKAFAAALPTAAVQAAGATAALSTLGSSMGTVSGQIVAGGQRAVVAFTGVSRSMLGLKTTANDVGTAIGQAFAKSAATAGGFIGGIAGHIRSLAMAGLQGTVEGNRLSWAWTKLSRELASIFKPAIDGVINAIEKTVTWFRSLTEGQQKLIMGFALAVPAAIAFIKVMTLLSANPLVLAFTAVAAVIGLVAAQLVKARGEAERLDAALQSVRKGQASKEALDKAHAAAGINDSDSPEEKARKAEEAMSKAAYQKKLGEAHEDERNTRGAKGILYDKTRKKAIDTIETDEALRATAAQGKKGKEVDIAGVKRQGVTPVAGGFEDITASYKRIQQAVGQQGATVDAAKKEAEEKKEKAERDKKINVLLDIANRVATKLNSVLGNPQQGAGG